MDSKQLFINACEKGYTELVRAKLEKISDLQALHIGLYKACAHGKAEIVELLLNDGRADPNANIGNINSALYIACYHGHTRVVELLLQDGRANQNIGAAIARTPLHAAQQQKHKEIEVLLLKYVNAHQQSSFSTNTSLVTDDTLYQASTTNAVGQEGRTNTGELQGGFSIENVVKSIIEGLLPASGRQGYKRIT